MSYKLKFFYTFLLSILIYACNEKEKASETKYLKSDAYLQNQLEQQYTDSYHQLERTIDKYKEVYYDKTATKSWHDLTGNILGACREIDSLNFELLDLVENLKLQLFQLNNGKIKKQNQEFFIDPSHLYHFQLEKIKDNTYNCELDSLLYLSNSSKQLRLKIKEFPEKVIEINNKYNKNNIFSYDGKRTLDFKNCFSSNNLFTSKKNDNLLANLPLSRIILLLTSFEIHLERSIYIILDKFCSTSRVEYYEH